MKLIISKNWRWKNIGSGNRSNFGKTKGSTIAEMIKKDYLVIKEKDLIKELENNNIKFNKKNEIYYKR